MLYKNISHDTDQLSPPNHIAIIMDGNSRWAKARNLPHTAGHKKGADALKKTIEHCAKRKVAFLTVYAFSYENWNRSEKEVQFLMSLLKFYLKNELKTLHKKGVRLKIIGNRSLLESDIIDDIIKAEELTKDNKVIILNIAISYGSRQEILNAVRLIAEDSKSGKISPDDIDERTFGSYLYTNDSPDPDLLIRTSGEERLSNFLLWQSAYTELYFTERLWPDFSHDDLDEAIATYHKRERRYGAR